MRQAGTAGESGDGHRCPSLCPDLPAFEEVATALQRKVVGGAGQLLPEGSTAPGRSLSAGAEGHQPPRASCCDNLEPPNPPGPPSSSSNTRGRAETQDCRVADRASKPEGRPDRGILCPQSGAISPFTAER